MWSYRKYGNKTDDSNNAKMISKLPDNTSYVRIGTFLTKISNIDTSNVTNMSEFFRYCYFLTEIPLIDTSNVTDMSTMFYSCESLIEIPPIDTSNVTNMKSTFQYCKSLETIPELNTQKVSSSADALSGTSALKHVGGFVDLGKGYVRKSTNDYNLGLSFHNNANITHESLMNIINKLYDLNLTYDVANGGTLYTQSLRMGNNNIAKLTAEEIVIATNKGWNVS